MLKDKTIRLLKAFSNESVRRLPYVLLVLITLVFVQFIKLNSQTAHGVQIAKDNSIDSKSLLRQVAQLSKDNKALSEQNNRIAKENAAHLNCVAELFAKYTQNLSPVLAVDLDNCFIQEAGKVSETAVQSSAQPLKSNPVVQSSSPDTTPMNTPAQLKSSLPEQPHSSLTRIVCTLLFNKLAMCK